MIARLLTICILLCCGQLGAQVTLDDFNDGIPTGWVGPSTGGNSHSYSESGGELKIDFTSNNPGTFPRATYTFPGGPIDLSMYNIMRVQVRTFNMSGSVNMRVDLRDTTTFTTNGAPFLLQPVISDGMHHVFEYDFSNKWFATFWDGCSCVGLWDVDSTVIGSLEFFVGYDLAPAGSDSIWIDYIEMDTVLLGACAGVTPEPKILDDFNCQQNVNYTFAEGFLQTVTNPDPTGNTSVLVGEYTRNANQTDAFGGILNLGPLDLTADNQMKVEFYNPNAPLSFRVVLQDGGGNDLSVKFDSSTAMNTWQTLEFDFSGLTDSMNVTNVVFLIDPGNMNLGGNVYYMDSIRFDGFVGDPCAGVAVNQDTLEDFECQDNINYGFVEGFLETVANPDPTGANTSAFVGKYTRNANNSDAWGGSLRAAPLDFSQNNQIKIDFWNSNAPVDVLMIFQAGINNNVATEVRTAQSLSAWETLTFDFSKLTDSMNVTDVVFLIGAGDNTLGGNLYFFDNIRLDGFVVPPCQGVAPDPFVMEDFDCQQNINYTFVEGGFKSIANPDMSGINNTPNVGHYTRNNTNADAFGGPFRLAPLDISTRNQIKMQVWDANAPSNVIIVLQDGGMNDLGSRDANTSVGNAWEELSFDFSFLPGNADVGNVVMLFDAGVIADSGNVYLFDNVRLDFPVGISAPVEGPAFELFPNPGNDRIDVRFETAQDVEVEVRLIDSRGRTVMQHTDRGETISLDTSPLAPGVYLVQLITAGGEQTSKRWVKMP